jgi:predicted secreted protein
MIQRGDSGMRTSSTAFMALAAAAGIGLLTGGCGTSERANAAPDRPAATGMATGDVTTGDVTTGDVTIGADRDGGHVPLRLGQRLTVRLAGDPGTGYGWVVEQADRRILAPYGGVSFAPAAAPRPGAGGMFGARFRAARPGETWLRLAYRRPFEPAKPPAATFAVHVMVT